ncbi:hypothetical protein [Diaphorobacter caeni]|uniref:hypothetical protein n=1 Tax=Diaphorobacter caeni TaxID=2784387 RepID=UPI00188F643F|nr:hypothetical protein [Diaphorobacter caeni]MBF5005024.1 hypothetical protein [Diaphorobacter caeni]
MHTETVSSTSPERCALESLLRAAKRLHRQATGESLAQSLPVLRRIIHTHTIRDVSLPELRRRRELVQRKHVLRMLAAEAGHESWEAYRQAVQAMGPDELAQLDVLSSHAGYPNHWFASFEEAERHAAAYGGRAVRAGVQGVVLAVQGPSAQI